MFGDHFMCTEGLADEIAVRDCIFLADIGEFIAKSVAVVFSLFQTISFFRFRLLKTNGSNKSNPRSKLTGYSLSLWERVRVRVYQRIRTKR